MQSVSAIFAKLGQYPWLTAGGTLLAAYLFITVWKPSRLYNESGQIRQDTIWCPLSVAATVALIVLISLSLRKGTMASPMQDFRSFTFRSNGFGGTLPPASFRG